MTIGRLMKQIRFWLFMGDGRRRAEYAKKKGMFAEIGENVKLPMTIPLYPKLVRVHNNVNMHNSVKLVTHDYINPFLMNMPDSYQYKHGECLTPIEIFDNVYISMDCVILGNVRIGPNVIVHAGSVVANDVPPNSIVSGVPAKVVGSFDMYQKSRILMDKTIRYEFQRSGRESIDAGTVEMAWEQFDRRTKRIREK